MDAEGVVLQTRNYTCGPAALATLLRKLGINTTENELAALAGTTEEGTTMQGLLEAAKAKGVNMTGMKLNITELHENMIAYTMSDGVGHYTLIREVNNETVKLADPTMGNIEMSLEGFQEIYTGYTLIINNTIDNTVELLENQNLENRTASDNQTGHEMNPMNISTDQPIQGTDSAKILSTEEMQK
ncbi:MAG: C39 family peptidase, partial [Methanobacteriaceae archaeon]|nr:C39 family peptidase [Methanobacteriaceae archaeon]